MVLIPDFIKKKKKIIAAYNKGRCVTPPLKTRPPQNPFKWFYYQLIISHLSRNFSAEQQSY